MNQHPAQAIKYQMVPYTRGNGVEVGGGQLYPHFRPVGDEAHESLDFVFTSTESPAGWDALIKPGGYLVSMQDDKLHVRRKTDHGMEMHTKSPDHASLQDNKAVCVVRYGGFGDSIQASGILPELKRQGYHITFMTTPRGEEILKHDPHIDAWAVQDDDQVPNGELHLFWAEQAKRFDRFINLSESVEGTLLAYPGRANHAWPDAVRRKLMGKNYLEWTAELAELPYQSEARFYPSAQEVTAAKSYLADFKNTLAGPLTMGMRAPDRFNILWCLSGSSIHKFYPHQDDVIARILNTMPEAAIVFNGDYACKILESGWEECPQIRCESGKMGIRDSLALAQQVDCVVGPETGVLNAVAFEPNGKVIMLSHSSIENLSKHWVNTDTLTPANTSCYPCHRLHFGREFCREDKTTGGAACQVDIAPDRVYAAIHGHYENWLAMRKIMELA